ncbi:MAG: polysaccharide biosynthesis protein [Clostridia bacterium]|nr:polysaccharide biosynthesis protein [Clostridia bacterium]
MAQVKKQTFMKGIIILFISQMLIKLLGFVYRVAITNLDGFGDIGNSYFGAAFQVYTVILAISTVGIPSALAKLVAERVATGNLKGAHRVFKVALQLFTVVGIVFSVFMFVTAGWVSDVIKNPGVKYSLWTLSPSVYFVAIAAVIRGYFQGYCDMKPQASSQVIDQVAKCLFTIALAVSFIGHTPEIMAAAATFGATVGTVVSFLYLLMYYNRHKKGIWQDIRDAKDKENEFKVESTKRIIKNIISLSIPIALGAVITSMAGMVNLLTVIPRLLDAGHSQEEAQALYGIISGKSDTILNLPLAINIAFATSLVPNISAALAVGNKEDASKKISFSVFCTILITLPAAVGLSVLSEPLIATIFPNAPAGGYYIRASAFAVIFMALAQTLNGSLQGMGKVYTPAIAIIIGAIIKYISNYILVYNIGIMGAAYSTIICYFVAATISFCVLNSKIHLKLKITKVIIKPLLASLTMGIVAYYSYTYLLSLIHSRTISTLSAVGIAMVIYAFMLFALNTFDREELEAMPVLNKLLKK